MCTLYHFTPGYFTRARVTVARVRSCSSPWIWVESLSMLSMVSESSCECVESGSSCTSLKSQGVCYIKLMAFIFKESKEAEEDAKADVQTRRTNLHMQRVWSVHVHVHMSSVTALTWSKGIGKNGSRITLLYSFACLMFDPSC